MCQRHQIGINNSNDPHPYVNVACKLDTEKKSRRKKLLVVCIGNNEIMFIAIFLGHKYVTMYSSNVLIRTLDYSSDYIIYV